MKNKLRAYRNTRLYLVLFVFVLLLVTALITFLLMELLHWLGVLQNWGLFAFVFLLGASVVIATALSPLFSEIVVRPYRKLMKATREIAAGHFDVRVALRGPFEAKQLAESFNLMAQELAGIETMRSDFVSHVSHEFKTPVSSIKGFAKLLQKEGLSEESRREYLDTIIREADRLTKLTDNALLLSKVERQGILSGESPFYLDEQLRKAALMLESLWEKKRLAVSFELPKCQVVANEELWTQVWLNLLQNAVKFTCEGGSMAVSLQKQETGALVRIADTGIGMDDETLKRIFDKFYQADPSRAAEGNGLGLALVKRIVALGGGSITVQSEPQKGSVFSVFVPYNLHKKGDMDAQK